MITREGSISLFLSCHTRLSTKVLPLLFWPFYMESCLSLCNSCLHVINSILLSLAVSFSGEDLNQRIMPWHEKRCATVVTSCFWHLIPFLLMIRVLLAATNFWFNRIQSLLIAINSHDDEHCREDDVCLKDLQNEGRWLRHHDRAPKGRVTLNELICLMSIIIKRVVYSRKGCWSVMDGYKQPWVHMSIWCLCLALSEQEPLSSFILCCFLLS